jgi:hypothetical protein
MKLDNGDDPLSSDADELLAVETALGASGARKGRVKKVTIASKNDTKKSAKETDVESTMINQILEELKHLREMVHNLTKDNEAKSQQITELTRLLANAWAKQGANPAPQTSIVAGSSGTVKGSYAGVAKRNGTDHPAVATARHPVSSGSVEGTTKSAKGGHCASETTGNPPPTTSSSGEMTVLKVKNSRWNGKSLQYLADVRKQGQESIIEMWVDAGAISAPTLVEAFHEAHPVCPRPDDYKETASWTQVKNTRKRINQKFKKNNGRSLTSQDLEFLAKELTAKFTEPRGFKKCHLKIGGKRALSGRTRKQRRALMTKIFQMYGIGDVVTQFSFIGTSVLEIYVLEEKEEEFLKRMKYHEWEVIDFQSDALLPFQKGQEEDTKKHAVNRLAFLYANTRLVKLRECILEGVAAEVAELVKSEAKAILETRAGERTANVQTRHVAPRA